MFKNADIAGYAIPIGSLAAVAAAVWFFASDSGPNGCSDKKAYASIQAAMASNLKSPASAVYPDWEDVSLKRTSACIFKVDGYLDSQNSFGAMIRTSYSGLVVKQGDGSYKSTVIAVD